jgi:hypothetical protein
MSFHTKAVGTANSATPEHMRITSAGNVGIGTTAPGYKLEVNGDVYANSGWLRSSGSTGWYNESYGGGWYMIDATWIRSYGNKSIYHNTGTMRTDGTFQVGASGGTLNVINGGNLTYRTNVLSATTGGNVGVGTAAPAQKLEVTGGTARVSALAGVGDRMVIANANGDLAASTSTINVNSLVDGSGTLNYLARWTPDGNTLGIGATYDNGTNVGIGTAAPADKLHINGGDLRLNDVANAAAYRIKSYSSGSSLWTLSGNTTSGSLVISTNAHDWDRQVALTYTPGTTGAASGNLQIGQLNKNNANWTHGVTTFYTNGTERMRISSNGNVGIGTSTPAQKFHVVGDARISGLSASGNVQANANGDLIISNDLPGGDGSYIQNQNSVTQTADWRISGTGQWGTAGILSADQGSSIELGGSGVPYIDIKNNPADDYDVRLQLDGNDELAVRGAHLSLDDNQLWDTRAIQMKDWDDDTGGQDDKYRILARDGAFMVYNGGMAIGAYSNGTWADLPDGNLIVKSKLGVNTNSPGGVMQVTGDFANQELVGTNVYNSLVQNVAWNAAATVIDLGSTDYVRVVKADGTGANNSSVLIVASVTVTGNDVSFANGIGGYQEVQALMNGMATFTVELQRGYNNAGYTTLIRQSAICGLAVGDWYSQYNGIANMQGKYGDEYRFPNSVSISYFDDPANGNVDYRLVITPGGYRKSGGNYQVIDRNLTAVQIKR